ncbi:MAG: coenzyme f390 synthetase-like protein, phenylacetate-CoA ligase, partial [Armatimonadetes bacterium CSP1-3]
MSWTRRIVWLIVAMTLLRIVLAVTVPLIDD